MTLEEIHAIQLVADKHVLRINQALDKLKGVFPLDAVKVQALDESTIFAIEMLTSRFSKLQDYIGNVVFNALFEIEGENTATWTMIDKVNKIEQYGIINDAHTWRDMRKSRNFLTHEYPDRPDITAASLNVIYSYVPLLLGNYSPPDACSERKYFSKTY
jgi:hypothetical protein